MSHFKINCFSCHGANAAGVNGSGPPLVHKTYEPSHHGDTAFYNAAFNGVPVTVTKSNGKPAREPSHEATETA